MSPDSVDDPSASVARATAAVIRGQRTGVVVGARGTIAVDTKGMEDLDEFWQSASSPKMEAVVESKKTKPLKPKNSTKKKKKRVGVKRKPRFSLPGQQDDMEGDVPPKSAELNKYLARAVRGDENNKWSPSDLSRVSTAPPTPALPESKESNQEESPVVTQENSDEPPESPVVTQEVEPPISPPEATRNEEQEEAHDESFTDFPPPPDNDDNDNIQDDAAEEDANQDALVEDSAPFPQDDDDDLVPPPPPEEEEEEEVAKLPAASQPIDSPQNANFLNNLDGLEDDESDGEDKEAGTGFNLVHDPETPENAVQQRDEEEDDDDEEQEEEELVEKQKRKKKKAPSKKSKKNNKYATSYSPKGYQVGNRNYEVIPVDDFVQSSPEQDVRRSKRARFKPLEYWRNEVLVYEAHDEGGTLGEAMGNMPVVTGVQTAMPTPYKKRKVPPHQKKGKSKSSRRSSVSTATTLEEQSPFDDRRLRKKYKICDDDNAMVWDDAQDDAVESRVIRRSEDVTLAPLKVPADRPKREGKVTCNVGHAFNVQSDQDEVFPGYIMGKLVIPPKGIKDAENAGGCATSFTLCNCQPNSVEVAYAHPDDEDGGKFHADTAQRYLVGPGDFFIVPPCNSYRLENHSKTTSAELVWTIIRPCLGSSQREAEGESSSSRS